MPNLNEKHKKKVAPRLVREWARVKNLACNAGGSGLGVERAGRGAGEEDVKPDVGPGEEVDKYLCESDRFPSLQRRTLIFQ